MTDDEINWKIIQAAAEVMRTVFPSGEPGEVERWLAEPVVAAVEPLIRADERDKIIAQLQEVHRLDPWARRNVFAGVDLAIRMIKDTADD